MIIPWNAELYLTERCNLYCAYCHRPPDGAGTTELSTAQWQAVIAELGKLKVLRVLFSGGEPLLVDGFRDLLECTVAAGMRFSLTTNGSLLSEALTRRIAAAGRCDYVQVSLDGSARIHDAARGQGSWQAAVAALDLLKRYEIPYQVKLSLGRHNIGRLREVGRVFFDELDIPLVSTNLVTNQPGKATALTPPLAEFGDIMREYADLLATYPGRFYDDGPWPVWRSWQQIVKRETKVAAHFQCQAWQRQLVFHADGMVSRCSILPQYALGKFGERSIAELLATADSLFPSPSKCLRCEWYDYCPGSCPGYGALCLAEYLNAGGRVG